VTETEAIRQNYELGVLAGEARREAEIVATLESECDCAFYAKYEIPSKCHAHKHIALIKGENK